MNNKKTVIITSGPTNERLDAVMQITNMSTGNLGAKVAETLLTVPAYSLQIGKVYYLSNKLAVKPDVPGDPRLVHVRIGDAQDLLKKLTALLTDPNERIDAVVHSSAVGDYKGRYAARAEDLADEIARNLQDRSLGFSEIRSSVLTTLTLPTCVQDDGTKISSYEPNLMFMLDLTTKVIGCVKNCSPDTMLIGFKLLESVSDQELYDVAARLRRKNRADYIIANDLARIGDGKHFAMIVSERGIDGTCRTKQDIAYAIAGRITGDYEIDETACADLGIIPDGYDANEEN